MHANHDTQDREEFSAQQVGLNPTLLAAAFPFHFVLDRELRLVQFGNSLSLLDEQITAGAAYTDFFSLKRPLAKPDYDSIRQVSASMFLFSLTRRDEIRLRGQMLLDDDRELLIFVGSPHFTSADDVNQAGLKLNDFAPHDSTPDLLLLLRTNQASLDDATKLADKLRAEKDHVQVVLSSIGEGVIATDDQHRISYMNAVAEQLTGHKQAQAKGQQLQSVFQLVDTSSLETATRWADLLPTTESPVELPQSGVLLHRDDNEIAVEGVIAPIQRKGQERGGLVLAFRDVTDQRNMSTLMEYQATHEQLTKLPNRMLLHERAEQAIREACRRREHVAVLFLDLDRFKTINDSLGHQVGDQLLKIVAKRLLATVRDADVVSRLGGDEFVILLTQITDPTTAGVIAQKVLRTLGEPIRVASYELNVSVSIGVSIYPDDSRDVEGLLRCADLAMYSTKDAGRGTFRFFESELDAAAIERMAIENHMRVALDRKQFELHYQPKLTTDNGNIIGCEALLRWNHPEKGQIPRTNLFQLPKRPA